MKNGSSFTKKHKSSILGTACQETCPSLEKNEDDIKQVSEEIESRVTKTLSLKISKTELSILGALSQIVEFLWHHRYGLSGTLPGTSRNTDVENQEPTGDRSQNEVDFSACHSRKSIDSDPEEASHRWWVRVPAVGLAFDKCFRISWLNNWKRGKICSFGAYRNSVHSFLKLFS